MSVFDVNRTPTFLAGYRLQWEPAQQAHVLLYPEGMVKLNESAAAIANEINGRSNVASIIQQLKILYPDAPPTLADDVIQFMEAAHEKFWLQLT
jgi:pyrroloquinoline quinone biosynthesis protein D